MEIKFADVSIDKLNYKLNFALKPNQITGVYGNDSIYLLKAILLNIEYSGNILVDGKELNENNKKIFCYIAKNPYFFTETVSDEFYLIKNELKEKSNNYIDKIISSLNMVGLSKKYLDKKFNSLSKSEKKLIQISLCLIGNPELIIFENTLVSLDENNSIRIKQLIENLKKEYQKNILLIDNNINNIYELSDQIIILQDDFLVGTHKEIFENIDYFNNHNLEIPDIVEFIIEAKKYNINLSYSRNLRELGKEVCKYVKEINKQNK